MYRSRARSIGHFLKKTLFSIKQEKLCYFTPSRFREKRHRKLPEAKPLAAENEFSCSVCLRLVVMPTTLTCGHTTCRPCLAQWYFNSKKKECPLCRLTYQGHPKVNTQIRNLIERLSPAEAQERQEEIAHDPNIEELLRNYDRELSSQRASPLKQASDVTSFCSGIIVAIAVVIVAYLAWFWQSADTNLLVNKPVTSWKTKDVSSWLTELGWASQYVPEVEEHQIDGTMLLSLDEKGLQKYLNISDETHDRALLLAIKILSETGLKPPTTLWEFKAIYPGQALFLVHGLKDFPRTTILYLYAYFYDGLFLPFLHATTGAGLQPYSGLGDSEPTLRQWVEFLVCFVLMPQWLVAVVAWQMFQHHTFSPLFVLAMALFYTVNEVLASVNFACHPKYRMIGPALKSYFKQLIAAFGFMLLWPIIPSLVCDCFFYSALYVGPLYAATSLQQKLSRGFGLAEE